MSSVTTKQEVEQKSEWFCGVKLFLSNSKAVRKQCLKNALVVFFVHMLKLDFNFYWLLDFLFNVCLIGLSNSFIVHSSFPISQGKFFELFQDLSFYVFVSFVNVFSDHITSRLLQISGCSYINAFFQLLCMFDDIFDFYLRESKVL